MREQDPRVPAEVEDYLVGLMASAGRLGGEIGGKAGGGELGHRGGGRGGERGGARGARLLKTVVAERRGVVPGSPADALARLRQTFPESQELQANGVRFVVPLGLSGLQRVVVDVTFQPTAAGQSEALLRSFAKEGLLSRHPAARIADKVWAALST